MEDTRWHIFHDHMYVLYLNQNAFRSCIDSIEIVFYAAVGLPAYILVTWCIDLSVDWSNSLEFDYRLLYTTANTIAAKPRQIQLTNGHLTINHVQMHAGVDRNIAHVYIWSNQSRSVVLYWNYSRHFESTLLYQKVIVI